MEERTTKQTKGYLPISLIVTKETSVKLIQNLCLTHATRKMLIKFKMKTKVIERYEH